MAYFLLNRTTSIKPQAWLLQGYAHRYNGTLYNLEKESHTELAEHILYYSNKQIAGKRYRFLFTVDLVAF